MLSLIEPDDIPVAHVPQKSFLITDAFDDRKLIEFTLAEEFERANQIVIRAQEDGPPIDEIVRQNERSEMIEVLSVAEIIERKQACEFTPSVLQQKVGLARFAGKRLDLCERQIR